MDPRVAIEKLAEMQPIEIAKFFESRGIMGCRAHGNSCPVHNYMLEETGIFVFAGYETIYQMDPLSNRYDKDGNFEEVPGGFVMETPQSVRNFMLAFDIGRYSHLRTENK